MTTTSGELNGTLKNMVDEMTKATGQAQLDAMARLLTALVAEHSSMQAKGNHAQSMMRGRGEEMGAMSCGMMNAPSQAGATPPLTKEELERADP
jgi:hypothetical protein